MFLNKTKINIRELNEQEAFSTPYLIFTGPHISGWGVIGTALLLPESVGLMVGPAGCLRHPCFAARERDFRDRLYALQLSETDMVMGFHMEIIRNEVKEIVRKDSPKVLIICCMCADYLLGSDYDTLVEELSSELGILISFIRMNPICMDIKDHPALEAYGNYGRFISDDNSSERTVNIIGAFAPIAADGELPQLLREIGYEQINQVSGCSSLVEINKMSRASFNILLHPRGKKLAEKMQEKFNIPYYFINAGFGLSTIRQNYNIIENITAKNLNYNKNETIVKKKIKSLLEFLSGKKIAVGSCFNGSPFETTRALSELGLDVTDIFFDQINQYEWSHIYWLQANKPNISVYHVTHPALMDNLREWETVELAIGLDAGYFCTNAHVVSASLKSQKFGYENLLYLLEEMVAASRDKEDHYQMIYSSGLIV